MKARWQTKTLGEVLQKTETTNPLQFPEAEFEYIDVSSVSNSIFQIEETQTLKGKDAPSRARRLVKTNDVIFATIRPTLRRIAVVPEHLDKQVCSTGYFVLRPKAEIDHRFLFYWLFTEDFMGQMELLQKGASYPAVTDAEVRAQMIPFPPLPEQQRIVGILDEAFDGIATAKANAEQNLQNARALFESHLQSVFTQRGEGWAEKRIEEVGTTQTGSTPKTSDKKNYGDFIPFIKPADFNTNGSLNYENDGLSEQGFAQARKVAEGSVLMVCIGATIGKCGWCDRDITTNQQTNALTLTEGASYKFIYYQMLTEDFQRRVIHGSGQATLPIINKSKWSALTVWLPPTLDEQEQIVAKLDALREETQRLESLYRCKLAALAELKKSLLHQAFTGQLTKDN
ncbi:MAG: restriction endonuclease subunit S [Nitrosomonadales bacterium]|nr:restriction endonuclease subunit S [Nitrosomonadales bacterium]